MNALAVGLLLLIEKSVLVLGQHLLLTGHLSIPPLNSLGALAIARKSSAQCVDNAVNSAEALALAGFLGRGQAPWGLPARRKVSIRFANTENREMG